MKIRRKKIGDRSYNLVDAGTGEIIATAAQTGEHGRDNYPWEFSLANDMIFGKLDARTGHSVETLRDAVDIVETGATQFGLLKPVGKVDPREIKEGQVLRVLSNNRNTFYRATQDSYGGYVVEIPANHSSGELTEVHVRPEDIVTLFEDA
jgi:hypothetical protein